MSIKELAQAIGKQGSATFTGKSGTLSVDVRIENVRQTFGRIDYQVKPVAGGGLMWLESSRVMLYPAEPETF